MSALVLLLSCYSPNPNIGQGNLTCGGEDGPCPAGLVCGCDSTCYPAQEVPPCMCTAPLADCDHDPTTGCEVDLTTDQKHCGACDRDCLGGACQAGTCQPFVLASAQDHPNGIAVESGFVYWTTAFDVEKCDAFGSGCADSPIRFSSVAGSRPVAPVLKGASAYWAHDLAGTIAQCPLSGCDAGQGQAPEVVLASGQSLPRSVAVDDAFVYWANSGVGSAASMGVYKCAVSGPGCDTSQVGQSAPTAVVTGVSVYEIALNGSDVYFTTVNAVMKCSLLGPGCDATQTGPSAPTVIASSQTPSALFLDSDFVYWSNGGGAAGMGTVLKCSLSLPGCDTAQGQPAPLTVASNQSQPGSLTVDGSSVYWVNEGDGSIARCARSDLNCSPEILASLQGDPIAITLDATNLYWVNWSNGTVMRLAKPPPGP